VLSAGGFPSVAQPLSVVQHQSGLKCIQRSGAGQTTREIHLSTGAVRSRSQRHRSGRSGAGKPIAHRCWLSNADKSMLPNTNLGGAFCNTLAHEYLKRHFLGRNSNCGIDMNCLRPAIFACRPEAPVIRRAAYACPAPRQPGCKIHLRSSRIRGYSLARPLARRLESVSSRRRAGVVPDHDTCPWYLHLAG
jgi:hypothetical protein